MSFFKKKKKVDQATLQRLGRVRDLYLESCDILGKTKKLSTFLSRYEDARRFIGMFNDQMIAAGQTPILEMYDDVDRVFAGRIGEVVAAEVAEAKSLRTDRGRQDRLNRLLQILEGFDRPDDGLVDDAIMSAEGQVFRVLEQGTDPASRPGPSGAVGVSEDDYLNALKAAFRKDGRERGFTDAQIEKALKDVFGK